MASKDQTIGALVLVVCVLGIVVYGWLVFLADEWLRLLILELTGFIAVAGILGIGAWIGWTMATTPPPKPIEELEAEIEEEKAEEEKAEEKPEEAKSKEAKPEKKKK
ncbi:transcriptional regulator [Candidatus Bathyarchaeota archaeon]|nr:MAG: transcriptional regulator [Candidatus Bathyarchaeota archaeon]